MFHHRWSDQISRWVVSDSLWPHELQHARPPCPSPTPGLHSDSRPLSQWCHPAISSSVVPFSSCPQFLPPSESFPMSQLFAWGGQSTGVSALASFLPKNTQDWSLLEWTGWISGQSYFANKGPSSQGYGFSSGHVWMLELDCEESWVPKNWCFWTVVLEKTLESPLDREEIQPVFSIVHI